MKRKLLLSLILTAALGMIAWANINRPAPTHIRDELQVMVPVPLQVLAAFGDRYLAANVGTWRAIMVGTQKLSRDEISALAQIQESAAWLNPGHEDNYYTATAILPWEGQLESTQKILQWATEARPYDVYAPFFHGFNALQFEGNFVTASQSARIAAQHSQDNAERQALTMIATRWSEKADDPQVAIRTVKQMIKETRDAALRAYLEQRVSRLQGLAQLRTAANTYKQNNAQPLTQLTQLVDAGLISSIPADPLGGGYTVKNNWPIMLPPKE